MPEQSLQGKRVGDSRGPKCSVSEMMSGFLAQYHLQKHHVPRRETGEVIAVRSTKVESLPLLQYVPPRQTSDLIPSVYPLRVGCRRHSHSRGLQGQERPRPGGADAGQGGAQVGRSAPLVSSLHHRSCRSRGEGDGKHVDNTLRLY